jgi:hypothetical protein
MTIIIPGMSSDHHRVEVRPRNVKNQNEINFYYNNKKIFIFKDSESLVERWKHNNMDNLLELHNKTPIWNEGINSTLNST